MGRDRATGDLRSALRDLFPDAAARDDDAEIRVRAEQKARLAAVAKQLARDREAPSKPTGRPGQASAGQALQIARGVDGRILPRVGGAAGKDWMIRVAAEPATPTGVNHWQAPPPAERSLPVSLADLAGQVFGRLTVLRYHRSHKKVGAQWLVRCVCGDYELRSTKALLSAPPDHACAECSHVEHLRWLSSQGARRDRLGDAARLFDDLAASARRKDPS